MKIMRRTLVDCQSGMAAVELAMTLPLLLTLFLGGGELAHNIMTRKKVAEIAMMVADNASRMGDDTVLTNKPISESEINDIFLGARIAAGGLDLPANGRVVLSSLERNASGGQWIHWQRCYGSASYTSPYPQGTGATGTAFPGVGPTGNLITASDGDAVMHVTVVYDYRPIFPVKFAGYTTQRFTATAAINVRDDRDLSGVQNPSPAAAVATCS